MSMAWDFHIPTAKFQFNLVLPFFTGSQFNWQSLVDLLSIGFALVITSLGNTDQPYTLPSTMQTCRVDQNVIFKIK